MNQSLSDAPATREPGSGKNASKLVSPCQQTTISTTEVGENSPSYYVGEGTGVPAPVRREACPARWLGHPGTLDTTGTTPAVLALDLGTHTGWALRDRDGVVTSGTEPFKPQRFEGGGMRYLRFKRWLAEVHGLQTSQNGLQAIFFEEVRRHASTDASHVYGGFLGLLAAFAEHHQISAWRGQKALPRR